METVTIKKNNKNYMDAYLLRNPNKKNEIHICKDCDQEYKYFNKSKHNKSKKHILLSEMKNKIFLSIEI
jgi:protein-arginine kinase activator protein McsA